MPRIDLELSPLTARSAVLSLLLGAHPAPLRPRDLSRLGALFDVPSGALRVALGRSVASGELVRVDPGYALGPVLVQRQQAQDASIAPSLRPWAGDWESAIVVVTGREAPDRAALRDLLLQARLGELREGVWMRPANLDRPAAYADDDVLLTFRLVPDTDAGSLAARLWDLDGWAASGRILLRELGRRAKPARRLAVAAAVVRQLRTDPILPAPLLPSRWPGDDLRAAYADYRTELAALTAQV